MQYLGRTFGYLRRGARSVDAVAHFVRAEELDEPVGKLVVERWSMQGAPTIEGLRRTLRDRVHVLIRVEGQRDS